MKNKGINISAKELEIIGAQLEMVIINKLRGGMRNPKDFKTLKNLMNRLQ